MEIKKNKLKKVKLFNIQLICNNKARFNKSKIVK